MTLVLRPFIHSALGPCSPTSGNSCIWRYMCLSLWTGTVQSLCPVWGWQFYHGHRATLPREWSSRTWWARQIPVAFPQRLVPQPIIILGCPLMGAQCTEWRELGEQIPHHAHPTEPFLLNKSWKTPRIQGPWTTGAKNTVWVIFN